jgi:hypothetical protein
MQGSGTSCRENDDLRPHRCLTCESDARLIIARSESDDVSAEARRAKAEAIHVSASCDMDCFASLAMTKVLTGSANRYRNEIASPLRSAFAINPTCWPESSSTAPF